MLPSQAHPYLRVHSITFLIEHALSVKLQRLPYAEMVFPNWEGSVREIFEKGGFCTSLSWGSAASQQNATAFLCGPKPNSHAVGTGGTVCLPACVSLPEAWTALRGGDATPMLARLVPCSDSSAPAAPRDPGVRVKPKALGVLGPRPSQKPFEKSIFVLTGKEKTNERVSLQPVPAVYHEPGQVLLRLLPVQRVYLHPLLRLQDRTHRLLATRPLMRLRGKDVRPLSRR